MFDCISKTKSIMAILLVLALLFIMAPMNNCESESVIINTHTSQNKMMFSPYDVSSTFFFSENANQFRESCQYVIRSSEDRSLGIANFWAANMKRD